MEKQSTPEDTTDTTQDEITEKKDKVRDRDEA
jgi:hypothetical protein